ncbi:MAG: hypothetical protein EA376_08930 [Phycisphaeraceae bacterium]|nr:MAG: hypothetical protein EA376_08930 [Phycisphaeraceae bacterium]
MTATGDPGAEAPRRQEPPPPAPSPEPKIEPRLPQAPAPASPSAAPPPGDPAQVWASVCERAPGAATRALLSSLSLRSCEGGRAVIAAASPDAVSYAKSKSEQIGKLMRECIGRPVRIEIVSDDVAPPRRAPATVDNSVYENPLVRQAMELFDAQVIGVEEIRQAGPAEPEQEPEPQQGG